MIVAVAAVGLGAAATPVVADHGDADRRDIDRFPYRDGRQDRDGRFDRDDRFDRDGRYDRGGRYDRAVYDRGNERCDYYRRARYVTGRDRDEIRRREILRSRLFVLADRVRFALRAGDIGPNGAERLWDRLDRVCDFLRNDGYLTQPEFQRRMNDLTDVDQALRRGGRYGRGWDRY
jgi:Ni/Co efflux regulator RcnB